MDTRAGQVVMSGHQTRTRSRTEAGTDASGPTPKSIDAWIDELKTDPASGLTRAEADKRLATVGPNALVEKSTSLLERIARYFWGPIPWMIEAAALLSAGLGDWADFSIIMTLLLANAGVEYWQESKAENAIEMLKQRLAPNARVLRDGRWQTLEARDLVPGDVVSIKLGNVTPADMVLYKGDYMTADELSLTGELLPVEKHIGEIAYSGSVVKLGEMTGIVTATGMKTYFGRTASLVEAAEKHSHFQRAVLRIGNFLMQATLVLVAIILAASVIREAPFLQTLKFALILTVAAIPVALPAVLSVTMAVGSERLARMKAIVSRLVAIEELSGVDVLCADKTGTLTRNELTIGELAPVAGVEARDLLLAATLASNHDDPDAIDAAVITAAGKDAQLQSAGRYERISFRPFDPSSKRTQAVVAMDGKRMTFAKGAPQVILDLVAIDETGRQRAEAQVDSLAADGFRTLGVARKPEAGAWEYLELIPIFDPPRDDAKATIARAREMGIGIKMITGDHEAIARQIAGQLGLGKNIPSATALFDASSKTALDERIESADGVARVLPENKFQIVKAFQGAGHIVAMTGDGVNDAPALKQADAGIAVSGATDAARAAADVVLTSPGLSVIAAAISESRRIFERMTSYATFRIAETIRVMLFMSATILVFDFYPVTAIMIVLLALLNDFPIMMIAYDNAMVATSPVRWNMRKVLTVATTLGVVGVIETFILFWYADRVLKIPHEMLQTVIFLKLLVAGHLTLYVTRNQRWFWQRPYPALRLFVATETTQVLGTLIAVYGLFVTPIGWTYALAVWAYALLWLPIEGAIAMAVRRSLSGATTATHASPR